MFKTIMGILSIVVLCSCKLNSQNTIYEWKLQSCAVAESLSYQQLVEMTKNIVIINQGRLTITPFLAGALAHGADITAFENLRQHELSITTWSQNDLKTWRTASEKGLRQYKAVEPRSNTLIDEKQRFKRRYDTGHQWFEAFDN